jgi:hypothetical protein
VVVLKQIKLDVVDRAIRNCTTEKLHLENREAPKEEIQKIIELARLLGF